MLSPPRQQMSQKWFGFLFSAFFSPAPWDTFVTNHCLCFGKVDVPNQDHLYTDQPGSWLWLSKETFCLRNFGLSGTPLQCLTSHPPHPHPHQFLCPGSNQDTAELNTIVFVLYLFKSVQLEPKPRSKRSHVTLSLEEGISLQVCFSDKSFSLPKWCSLNKLWITSSYILLVCLCITQQPLPRISLLRVVSSCSVTHCWSQLPILMILDWFQCQNLCIVIFAYACPSVGMTQVNSCTKGKCLSALDKITKLIKIL